jgi:hypothetical protein
MGGYKMLGFATGLIVACQIIARSGQTLDAQPPGREQGQNMGREPRHEYPLPELDRISVSKADRRGMLRVIGEAGAVPADALVHVQSLESGAMIKTRADDGGRFETRLPAPDGSTVVVNYTLTRREDRSRPGADMAERSVNWSEGSPALFLTVNPRRSELADGRVSFATAGSPGGDSSYWIADGTLNRLRFDMGDVLEYRIRFNYFASAGQGRNGPRMHAPELSLCRMSDSNGRAVQATYMPTLMTPTGLPIFSRDGYEGHQAIRLQGEVEKWAWSGDELEVEAAYSVRIPRELPPGYYVGKIDWQFPRSGPPRPAPFDPGEMQFEHGGASQNLLPVFRIGDPAPPRIPWVLLANTVSNGTRGGVCREDRGQFDLGTKVTFNADQLIIPRDDPDTGRPITYRLEPFLPTISYAMGGPNRPVPPLVSFVFPSGELAVSVTRPNGTTELLGKQPFRAGRTKLPGGGGPQSPFGPSSVEHLYELTTLSDDKSFEYQFHDYGHHVVRMEGMIEDAYGNVFEGGGSYDVYVARSLDLDPGTFLSTPFEVGNTMSPTVHVRPPLPADVEIDMKLYPESDVRRVVHQSVTGRANRFGYFHPGRDAEALPRSCAAGVPPANSSPTFAGGTPAPQLTLTSPGEYVVNIQAHYTDADGVLWMGAMKGASVVETPNPKLIAHGKRGITHSDVKPATTPQWYVMKSIDPPGSSGEEDRRPGQPSRGATPMMFYPFASGDVQWAADDSGGGLFPIQTVHDPHRVTRLEEGPQPGPQGVPPGELAVVMPAAGILPAVQHPEAIRTWAYYYIGVQRPGVTVRSFVASGEEGRAYWQFGDGYNAQLGNGPDGDRPGDVKLQYGGVVYRDTEPGTNQYAIYGSMAVMIPRGTRLGQRVFPPFQGAAGGPSGGPILTLDGDEIDLFFTPVGVMPGSVLETGDTFSFSGAVWPTLPSRVEVRMTKPSGEVVASSGRANKIGHFYEPQHDFVLTEPGIYAVHVRVVHDGETSAGRVEEPYPTGSVLGARENTFHFYVVDSKQTQRLEIDTPRLGARLAHDAGFHPGKGFTMRFQPSVELADPIVHVTVNLTGTVLDSRFLRPEADGSYACTYDLFQLRKRFDQLDPRPSDTVVVSAALVGLDRSGKTTALARQVLFQGAEVFVPDAF